jgi:hypothetical protein
MSGTLVFVVAVLLGIAVLGLACRHIRMHLAMHRIARENFRRRESVRRGQAEAGQDVHRIVREKLRREGRGRRASSLSTDRKGPGSRGEDVK